MEVPQPEVPDFMTGQAVFVSINHLISEYDSQVNKAAAMSENHEEFWQRFTQISDLYRVYAEGLFGRTVREP